MITFQSTAQENAPEENGKKTGLTISREPVVVVRERPKSGGSQGQLNSRPETEA